MPESPLILMYKELGFVFWIFFFSGRVGPLFKEHAIQIGYILTALFSTAVDINIFFSNSSTKTIYIPQNSLM